MHDLFSLPASGYPRDLLPIRQEIVNRTVAGHVDSAYEMYQYELASLREQNIPAFELPREYFALEHQLLKLDFETDREELEACVKRMQELQIGAGIPPERVLDPIGAGLPQDLRDMSAQMLEFHDSGNLQEMERMAESWLALHVHYGLLTPSLPVPDEEDGSLQLADSPEFSANHREYLILLGRMAAALSEGAINEVMQLHERQIELSQHLPSPVERLPREYFELQHQLSVAARSNNEADLALLQASLQQFQPGRHGMFEDPSGIMGLPPAYAELALAAEAAFKRGDHVAAQQYGRQMQDIAEGSGLLFTPMKGDQSGRINAGEE
jgi:hypothetical protein